MLFDKVLDYPVCPIFDTDSGKVPHKVIRMTARTVVTLDHLIAAITKVVSDIESQSGQFFF
jgi:hypothetical protein